MHRVMMNFQLRGSWYVHFLEADARTPVKSGRYFKFASELTLREFLIRCNATETTLAEFERDRRQWSRGSVWLDLTEEQYDKIASEK